MAEKTLPTLYSKNSDGSINEWTISIKENLITKKYGRVNGALQEETEIIKNGKNTGKKNSTNIEEQTIKEATASWMKKKKSGYVESINDAKNDILDLSVISGGIEPMLAHKFKDHSNKINYPAFVQPKLDGIRCIAIIDKNNCTLWSRTRKQIMSVPHICTHLIQQFSDQNIILDGELYNHDLKSNFEKIVSIVRSQKPCVDSQLVKYYIYDTISEFGFDKRLDFLRKSIKNDEIIKLVETNPVEDAEELDQYFQKYRKEGFEGIMVRNSSGGYQHKRSYNLQKIKEMDDKEFEIVNVRSGKGRMEGKAIFTCKVKDNIFVDVKLEGTLNNLEKIYNEKDKVIGKMLTIRFQGYTKDNNLRFPVGVAIRDYE